MADSDLVHRREKNAGLVSLDPEDRRRRLIAISARVGVWGIIGGLSSIAVGFLSPGVALNFAALGFCAGGVGAIGTSVLVLGELKRAPPPPQARHFRGFSLWRVPHRFLPRRLPGMAVPHGTGSIGRSGGGYPRGCAHDPSSCRLPFSRLFRA